MIIQDDMQAMADDLMRTFGVEATYKAGGTGEGVAVTVRCKPKRLMTMERGRMWIMEISVRATEVAAPNFGDVFTIDTEDWKLSSLPLESYEINSTAMNTLWQLTLVKDAISTGRGGV